MTMQSSSQGRNGYPGYQGYPYVNPVVHDVPSISAETASRWANLPRRPMQDGLSVVSPGSSSEGGRNSQTTQRYPGYQGYPYVNPVYTDVSGSVSSGTSGGGSSANISQTPQQPQTPSKNDTLPPKRDIDENPVVYVDMPETGSAVSRSMTTPGNEEPEFVQDTILYNPFENRRIGSPKDAEGSMESMVSEDIAEIVLQDRIDNARPPNTLNLSGASGSTQVSPSRQTPGLPSFMSKESQIYGSTDGADGYPLSPIPISEFPAPPPAYTEVDERAAREPPRVEEPRVVETPQPPRTQVIVNEPAGPMNPMHMPGPVIGHRNIDQKNLVCHHCGARVHTIVQKESGGMTHLIAFLVFFVFVPLVLIVYLVDYFKYKNHYCPNCFKLIGYETPIIGQKVTYVT